MQASLSSAEKIGPRLLLLGLRPEAPFYFKAGQFLILPVPPEEGAPAEAKPQKGFYSIASAEQDSNHLELIVEEREGRVSTWVSSRKVGENLELEGPLGKFSLVEPHQERQVFIGEGAGLAPLRSMILSLLQKKPSPQIDLFQVARLEADLLLDLAFEHLEETHSNFHYHPLTSDGAFKGDVAEALGSQIREHHGMSIYAAGFKAFLDPLVKGLEARGFPKDSLRVESFG
jgi:ferredoxin-NADP reductase